MVQPSDLQIEKSKNHSVHDSMQWSIKNAFLSESQWVERYLILCPVTLGISTHHATHHHFTNRQHRAVKKQFYCRSSVVESTELRKIVAIAFGWTVLCRSDLDSTCNYERLFKAYSTVQLSKIGNLARRSLDLRCHARETISCFKSGEQYVEYTSKSVE